MPTVAYYGMNQRIQEMIKQYNKGIVEMRERMRAQNFREEFIQSFVPKEIKGADL